MAIASRIYVSTMQVGNLEGCRALGEAIIHHVAEFDAGKKQIHPFWRILQSEAEVDSEFIVRSMIDKATSAANGIFPFLTVNLTYNPDVVGADFLSDAEVTFALAVINASVNPRKTWR